VTAAPRGILRVRPGHRVRGRDRRVAAVRSAAVRGRRRRCWGVSGPDHPAQLNFATAAVSRWDHLPVNTANPRRRKFKCGIVIPAVIGISAIGSAAANLDCPDERAVDERDRV